MHDPVSSLSCGADALVELLLAQAAVDKSQGINSAGYVSGYRGSPLGGLDQALWRRNDELIKAGIRFQPAINEELAATALTGTQKVETDPEGKVSGVFGMWYGKGPGVDRASDALRHGNAYGSSPHGGVLVIAGDDHGCESSSFSHQSDVAMMAWSMPVLHPASVADYKKVGLWGWAASRVSGAWVGFKAISETVESAAMLNDDVPDAFVIPEDIEPGCDGLHWRWPDPPGPQVEKRLKYKLKAVEKFARLNPIDRVLVPCRSPVALLVTVGKVYRDVLEALRIGGLTPDDLAAHGIALLHITLVFPLSPLLQDLIPDVRHIFVIEEKKGVVEGLIAQFISQTPTRHPIDLQGKCDRNGQALLPNDALLRPSLISPSLADWLSRFDVNLRLFAEWTRPSEAGNASLLPVRKPYFCAGCPHNTSTRVPKGSHAQPGIGCHGMVLWMARNTGGGLVQMGGEGVDWIGHAPFTARKHVFQNIGDGTYFHSGYLAIRQSIAAGSNITYKILFNSAVAMTGGQAIDGELSAPQIAQQMLAEGAKAVAIVAQNPQRYGNERPLPPTVKLYHRDELDSVQREFRELEGVTVIIYDQVCASQLRRRRKRGLSASSRLHVAINDYVCEGCGNCQQISNCLAIEPIDTPLGRKRAIVQNACNVDLSCLKGCCPSFVTIEDGQMKKGAADGVGLSAEMMALINGLQAPALFSPVSPYEILFSGIGGTGVVTAANIVAQAAARCGFAVGTLNFSGFAQKGGVVLSHIRFCVDAAELHQVRIDSARADLVIAADMVAGVDARSLDVMSVNNTTCVVNTHMAQTDDMLRDPSLRYNTDHILSTIRSRSLRSKCLDAEMIADRLLGDRQQTNLILLGHAWQSGLLPVSLASIESVIAALGNISSTALDAFRLGRVAADAPEKIAELSCAAAGEAQPRQSLDALISHHTQFLVEYQNVAYAERYAGRMERLRSLTSRVNDENLVRTIAENLFTLMAYKDEYEVPRLYVETDFLTRIKNRFGDDCKVRFHMSPAFWHKIDPRTGHRGKIVCGPWIIPLLKILAKARFLRGTLFDVFGGQRERRLERKLLLEYEALVDEISNMTQPELLPLYQKLAELPARIRGFGHIKSAAVERTRRTREELLAKLNALHGA
ncbi:indolepyruvate ferredoxin oxidoreductase family protein [Brenneria corticis]|uniref:2-oxoacid ferredoxin oxidoreductase n=1 Tax=Brenneria corticis TaxID=2173106 RepID=A0A2U1U2V6_9GAMM|nr:indolepyruvate ferredoxin oxidoreductase family protein [Brenneria sp. CFCC 11842]PWC15991.1 2-oxoacid ferredoxin oxidoreductase [Brenneria sp. CFCC 11842]